MTAAPSTSQIAGWQAVSVVPSRASLSGLSRGLARQQASDRELFKRVRCLSSRNILRRDSNVFHTIYHLVRSDRESCRDSEFCSRSERRLEQQARRPGGTT